jgi:hypothetical protein
MNCRSKLLATIGLSLATTQLHARDILKNVTRDALRMVVSDWITPFCLSVWIPDDMSPDRNGRRATNDPRTDTCDVVGVMAGMAELGPEDVRVCPP